MENGIYIDELLLIKELNDANFEYLQRAINSTNDDIRELAFSSIANFSSEYDVWSALTKGVLDENPLISSDCLGYVAKTDKDKAEELIIERLFDPRTIVSCTALELIINYPNNEQAFKFIESKLLDPVVSSSEKVRGMYALYFVNGSYGFHHLSQFMDMSKDYRDRCALLNMLIEGIRDNDVSDALKMIEQRNNIEPFKSVKNLLKELKEKLIAL